MPGAMPIVSVDAGNDGPSLPRGTTISVPGSNFLPGTVVDIEVKAAGRRGTASA
jgi:hypothetical protein